MAEEAVEGIVVPSARPFLDEADREAIRRVFDSGKIADGDEIHKFESELAAKVNCKGAVAVSSGFAALHLCLVCLNIGHGDEVIIPCVSTCHAIRNSVLAVGATPIFADTNSFDFNLSLKSVRNKISRNTRAIIAPHHTGIPSNVHALNEFEIPVIEDCAQALGATFNNRPVGSLGFAAIFSFYATKMITSVDGGMITSQSIEFLERIRDLRYYRGKWDSKLRYNYKMQNLHAALGRTQLAKLPYFLKRREYIASRYIDLLCAHSYSPSASLHQSEGAVYFRFGARFTPSLREKLIRGLKKKNFPFFTEVGFLTNDGQEEYINAHNLSLEVITFPTYPALTDIELELLLKQLDYALERLSCH